MSEAFIGTQAVQERHRFDEQALLRYLKQHVEGFHGPLTVEQFKGGQSNPTYKLITPGKTYVLRRKPPGQLVKSAHAVDREYRVITALADTEVPVARTHCLCEDESVIGTAFYVMDCVDGRVLWDPTLPGIDKAERSAYYREMNRVIAALHQVDYAAVGLNDYGKPGNYFARQISRWGQQYQATDIERIEAMDNLLAWLPDNIPPGDETTIVHGDYRLDNMIFHPSEPRVLAVLDWELSTLGHPLADFSYHCMSWHMPNAGTIRGLAGQDLQALGIPREREYVEWYFAATGRPAPSDAQWHFYMAYNLFRMAGILHGILVRTVTGTAASKQAKAMGAMARPCAELGWQIVQKIK